MPFKIDSSTPLRRQQSEPAKAYAHFTAWHQAGCPDVAEFGESRGLLDKTALRYAKTYGWQKRADLKRLQEAQPVHERMYPTVKAEDRRTSKKASQQKRKAESSGLKRVSSDVVLPPPPSIDRGLHKFCLKYARTICPGFTVDKVMDLLLTELEAWIEGETEFLALVPSPRSGKTTAAICAMVYSYLRYPTRPQIMVSASGRLSAITCQKMKALFEVAAVELPEGYGLSASDKSKTQWSGNWENVGLQYAASRGGALLGLSSVRTLIDDPLSSVTETESKEVMETTMRNVTTDVLSRRTPCFHDGSSGICLISQRLASNDVIGELSARDHANEQEGFPGTPWRLVLSPFVTPTKEQSAKLVGEFPNGWVIVQPQYGEPGEPVSERFPEGFADVLRAQMSPRDFNALYLCDTTSEGQWSAWKDRYLQPVPEEDVNVTATFAALDMSLIGGDGRDSSAMVIGGVHEDGAIIVGIHELIGEVDQQLGQIVDLAQQYRIHTLGVEQAASGAWVMKSLNNNLGDRTFNVVSLSHQGKNKGARLNDILGPAANRMFYIQEGLKLTDKLNQQLRLIARTNGKTHKSDDIGDAAAYCLSWIWGHWCKAGWNPTAVTWQAGPGGAPGVTECHWGYGGPRLARGNAECFKIAGFS